MDSETDMYTNRLIGAGRLIIGVLALWLAAAAMAADLKQMVVDEGLGPKVDPYWVVLESFPVTVAVEFQVTASEGRDRVKKGRNRFTRQRDGEIVVDHTSGGAPLAIVTVKSPMAMLRLLRRSSVVNVRPNDDLSVSTTDQALEMTNITAAKLSTPWYTGEGVSVAVIDTGIRVYEPDCNGPDYQSATRTAVSYAVASRHDWTTGVNRSCWKADDRHGTIVGELILAAAPKAKLISLRIAGDAGGGTVSNMSKAVDWIVANRAAYNIKVANISMSSNVAFATSCSTSMSALMAWLLENGVVPVVSAGNNGFKNGLPEPACSPYPVAVSSIVTNGGTIPYWANTGAALDVLTPGCTINTATSKKEGVSGLNFDCGTSFAAPIVSGFVAGLMGKSGFEIKATQVRALLNGATDTRVRESNGIYYPLLDATSVIDAAGYYVKPVPPTTVWPKYTNPVTDTKHDSASSGCLVTPPPGCVCSNVSPYYACTR